MGRRGCAWEQRWCGGRCDDVWPLAAALAPPQQAGGFAPGLWASAERGWRSGLRAQWPRRSPGGGTGWGRRTGLGPRMGRAEAEAADTGRHTGLAGAAWQRCTPQRRIDGIPQRRAAAPVRAGSRAAQGAQGRCVGAPHLRRAQRGVAAAAAAVHGRGHQREQVLPLLRHLSEQPEPAPMLPCNLGSIWAVGSQRSAPKDWPGSAIALERQPWRTAGAVQRHGGARPMDYRQALGRAPPAAQAARKAAG